MLDWPVGVFLEGLSGWKGSRTLGLVVDLTQRGSYFSIYFSQQQALPLPQSSVPRLLPWVCLMCFGCCNSKCNNAWGRSLLRWSNSTASSGRSITHLYHCTKFSQARRGTPEPGFVSSQPPLYLRVLSPAGSTPHSSTPEGPFDLPASSPTSLLPPVSHVEMQSQALRRGSHKLYFSAWSILWMTVLVVAAVAATTPLRLHPTF